MLNVKDYLESNPALLAPMAGVTDRVFRALCKEKQCGMTFTEMVSAKGMHFGGDKGKTQELLGFAQIEIPGVVQIFGRDPAIMAEQAQKLCDKYGDQIAWIDVNMGCPAPKITKNGEGSALMKEPAQAKEVLEAVVKASPIPVTVKFRKGWDDFHVNAVDFAKLAQDAGVAAVCVHGRTREQFYTGKADWDIIAQVKQALNIPIIGNGDIFCAQDAKRMMEYTGVDAVMVARGAQGNPWIFEQIKSLFDLGIESKPPTPQEQVEMALRHAKGLLLVRPEKAVIEMRKHIAWYISGIRGAAQTRAKVNSAATFEQVEQILMEMLIENELWEQKPLIS